jgi:hypothetical protein
VWHAEPELGEVDAVVLPGGFAHGDHLRTGAIARFSPVMRAVEDFAGNDRLWLRSLGFGAVSEVLDLASDVGEDVVFQFDGVNVTWPLFGTLSAEPASHDIASYNDHKLPLDHDNLAALHHADPPLFDKEHNHAVGLIHSTADLVHHDSDINADHEIDNVHLQCDILAERHFFYPVTVGTVDQLLNTLFHSGKWAMKTFAAMDAAIVIDEVERRAQAAPFTLAAEPRRCVIGMHLAAQRGDPSLRGARADRVEP